MCICVCRGQCYLNHSPQRTCIPYLFWIIFSDTRSFSHTYAHKCLKAIIMFYLPKYCWESLHKSDEFTNAVLFYYSGSSRCINVKYNIKKWWCWSWCLFWLFNFQKTVDCMTTMSVPSTLVKCLYLFFDLPHMTEAPVAPTSQPPPPPPPTPIQEKTPGQGQTQPELAPADRRALLQKVFVQV